MRKKVMSVTDASLESLPFPQIPSLADRPWNIAVTGVGGTGVLTIGALLGMAAHIDGHASMILDMAGLAQKGGAVLSHVRLAREPSMVTSPHIVAGSADLLIAADAVVAASRDGIVLCDPERTAAVMNTTTAPVASFVRHRDIDFKYSAVEARVAQSVKSAEHFHQFGAAAEQRVGDTIATNIMMLGYAWQCGLIPLSFEALDAALALNGVAVKANQLAFHWGRKLALEPSLFNREAGKEEEKESDAFDLDTLDGLLAHREQHLTAYQGAALARRYSERVDQIRKRCESLGLDEALPRVVATQYARLLSRKDEYEVARLYSQPGFRDDLEKTFEGEYAIKLHLAPPFLGGSGPDGRPRKRAFGAWVLSVFKLLQYGRKLRDTPLDVFGYSAERRAEREWIALYEQDMELVMDVLRSDNVEPAIQLLSVPAGIRGFGIVKHKAMQEAALARAAALLEVEAQQASAQQRAA